MAVTGVSTQGKDHGSNVVDTRPRERGYAVFAIDPNADEVEGDRCPCMFGPTADPGHRAMRTVLTLTGNVPRRVRPRSGAAAAGAAAAPRLTHLARACARA